jgi:3-oxoadipate enol-lactonase
MLSYKLHGHGIPLVLLHAFPLSSEMWAQEAESLSGFTKIIAPDLPGFGGSPHLSKPSIPEIAKHVNLLLEQLHIKEPVVVGGLSMGGYVAFEFLRQFQNRVKGLCLFSTRAAADTPEAREKRFKTIEAIEFQGVDAFVVKMIPNLLGATTVEKKQSLVTRVAQMIRTSKQAAITEALRAMADRRDSSDLLPKINVPCLIMTGSEDSFIAPQEAEAMHAQIPGSEFHIIQKAGHLINLEQSAEFNRILGAFLTQKIKP